MAFKDKANATQRKNRLRLYPLRFALWPLRLLGQLRRLRSLRSLVRALRRSRFMETKLLLIPEALRWRTSCLVETPAAQAPATADIRPSVPATGSSRPSCRCAGICSRSSETAAENNNSFTDKYQFLKNNK